MSNNLNQQQKRPTPADKENEEPERPQAKKIKADPHLFCDILRLE